MLQVIITATLLITGMLATKEQVSQTTSAEMQICLATNWELEKTNFHSKQNTHLLKNNLNPKKENERETI